ncbi:MAG: DedA family protein [Bacteroidales bacterium]|jgi:membrane protein DedA with SNARE-associated domain|nr:DedA family protein [Bacteroidales bacterium]
MKKVICICIGMILFYHVDSQNIIDSTKNVPTNIEEDKSVLSHVIDWYTEHLNYGSITLLMAVESSFIPLPSEVVVPPAAYTACLPESSLHISDHNLLNVFLVVLFATLGALIGALFNYFLALFLGRPVIYWFADSKIGHLLLLSGKKIKKAEDYFNAHGNSSTFIGRLVPVVRQLISIPAGVAKMRIVPFVCFTILGAFIWNVVLALLGFLAHGQKDMIDKYSHELSWILLALGVMFVIYLIIKEIVKRKRRQA